MVPMAAIKKTDTAPLTQPMPNLQDGTTAPPDHDPEDPQQVDSSCEANMRNFGEFLGYVILAVVASVVIAALGVLTLPVSVALLLVFIITYTVIKIVSSTSHEKNKKRFRAFTTRLTISTTAVAVLLLLSLIFLFVVFRVYSSLKDRMIAGLETWKWLEIALVSCVFCNIWTGGRFVLNLVQEEYDYKENLVYFTSKLRRAINCICFIVGELLVLEVAPTSKKVIIIFGLALWKWVLVLVSLLCGWYLIAVVTHVLVLSLEAWQNKFWKKRNNEKRQGDGKKSAKRHTMKKYAVFMAKGLRTRVNILLMFLLIVLTYRFYVKPRLELNKESDRVKEAINFVIRTFLSLLIAAVLSVIKKFLLLLWEARELYKRFTERIIATYMQLYFLAKICGSVPKMLNIWAKTADGQGGGIGGEEESLEDDADRGSGMSTDQDAGGSPSSIILNAQGSGRRGSVRPADAASDRDAPKRTDNQEKQEDDQELKRQEKKKRVDEDANAKLQQILEAAIGKFVSYDIQKRIAKLFIDAEDALASDKVEKMRLKWEEHRRRTQGRTMTEDNLVDSMKQVYNCGLEKEAATCLYRQLQADLDPKRDVQYKDFENWLKKAHKYCTQLGNTLAGAQEAVAYLNKIMVGFLIAVCVVIWLFLTRIATTDLIVLLTSPLLAAAFIFGDTAKTMFQGIVFAFAVHPFDVGDICIIEGNQLEVKKIGIWKTTFYRNGNRDGEVMYPNSTLINTSIVKHKFNLDHHDSIEFTVKFNLGDYAIEDKAINKLIEDIKAHLKNNNNTFEPGFDGVTVKEINEAIKMEVQFKHKKNVQHMTHSDCLRKKNESRSKLLQEIRKLIDKVRKECQPITAFQSDGNIGHNKGQRCKAEMARPKEENTNNCIRTLSTMHDYS